MRIGFIGLGNMGEPMAGFVLGARYSLVVHDLRREAAAALLMQAGQPRHAIRTERFGPTGT